MQCCCHHLLATDIGGCPPIHIIVKNGHVNFEGAVSNQADKDLVNTRANTIPNVLFNDQRLASRSDIALAVKDGVVTLSGFVPSYWEKDAAEKAAKRVYGCEELPTIFKSN
jgi:osmotically-inducible protein OsmY